MKVQKSENQLLRESLVKAIVHGNAHVNFEQAIHNLLWENIGIRPFDLPYSIWMLVEHIRTVQEDILDFSRNPNYKPRNWPDDFWPKENSPATIKHWKTSLEKHKQDRDLFIELIQNTANDLLEPFPYGDGQNLLNEALLIVDHTSYHVGEIIVLRRLLKDWEG